MDSDLCFRGSFVQKFVLFVGRSESCNVFSSVFGDFSDAKCLITHTATIEITRITDITCQKCSLIC